MVLGLGCRPGAETPPRPYLPGFRALDRGRRLHRVLVIVALAKVQVERRVIHVSRIGTTTAVRQGRLGQPVGAAALSACRQAVLLGHGSSFWELSDKTVVVMHG